MHFCNGLIKNYHHKFSLKDQKKTFKKGLRLQCESNAVTYLTIRNGKYATAEQAIKFSRWDK